MRLRAQLSITLFLLITQSATAQEGPSAALSGLTTETREWVNRSCSRTLGPSLWSSCVEREASAALAGKPDLSGLSPELRAWVIRSCSDTLGPSLTISCLNREKAALASGLPDLSSLTEEQKRWLMNSCSTSLGPSLYMSCIRREFAAIHDISSAPDNPPVTAPLPPVSRSGAIRKGTAQEGYEIEVAHNDELFVINGEKFEAQTYCLGWEEGDKVLFLEGSPLGACSSAVLLNIRTREKCDVWCE